MTYEQLENENVINLNLRIAFLFLLEKSIIIYLGQSDEAILRLYDKLRRTSKFKVEWIFRSVDRGPSCVLGYEARTAHFNCTVVGVDNPNLQALINVNSSWLAYFFMLIVNNARGLSEYNEIKPHSVSTPSWPLQGVIGLNQVESFPKACVKCHSLQIQMQSSSIWKRILGNVGIFCDQKTGEDAVWRQINGHCTSLVLLTQQNFPNPPKSPLVMQCDKHPRQHAVPRLSQGKLYCLFTAHVCWSLFLYNTTPGFYCNNIQFLALLTLIESKIA